MTALSVVKRETKLLAQKQLHRNVNVISTTTGGTVKSESSKHDRKLAQIKN